MKDVKEQKQNDNGEIIEMKQGQVIKIPKNGGKAWLTLFYSLPQEFVSKRPVYLNLPRCPYEVLRTDKYDSLIKDDTFLELVWDCVAWSAWQYFEIPYQNGSGYREIPQCGQLKPRMLKIQGFWAYILDFLYKYLDISS